MPIVTEQIYCNEPLTRNTYIRKDFVCRAVSGEEDDVIQCLMIERFSTECRKTKTKVITLTNHNRRKQSNKPIRARSKYIG